MKMDKFAAKVSAVALCAAATALATPAHAQWMFMGTKSGTLAPGANNGSGGGPTITPPVVTDTSLTAASGGSYMQLHGGGAYAKCTYDLPIHVTYVWQGPGTPTASVSVTETDTLTAKVTFKGPADSSTGSSGVDGTNEIATAYINPNAPNSNPSDTPPPFVRTYTETAAGASCTFDIGVNATASGFVVSGASFTAQGTATVSFK